MSESPKPTSTQDDRLSERTNPPITRTEINTGGGAYVDGSVSTNGGDFVGRDKNIFQIVVERLDERVFKRFGLGMTTGFVLTCLTIIIATIWLYWTLGPQRPERMGGGFNIAVAQFAHRGNSQDITVSEDFSHRLFVELQTELGRNFTIWGPDWVGRLKGDRSEDYVAWVSQVADDIEADIVIYGIIDTSTVPWQMAPDFYVSPRATRGFDLAGEAIEGDYTLGAPFDIGQGDVTDREEANNRLIGRVKVLSGIVRGLSFYTKQNYEKAQGVFDGLRQPAIWRDEAGKQIVYQLTGATAGKLYQIDDTLPITQLIRSQQAYEKSLEIDPSYARAYLGLAGVYYLHALRPVTNTQAFDRVDQHFLDLAIATYITATQASNQSVLAEIPIRVDFGLAQCFLLKALAQKGDFDLALTKFQTVINYYNETENPSIKTIAAESHARLGFIYSHFAEYLNKAIEEYENAISLIKENPKRQEHFREQLEQLKRVIQK